MYSCCCIDHDFEPGIVSWENQHIARTEHKCHECGETINPGENYERCRWMDPQLPAGAKWRSNLTCWFCLKIRGDFFDCGWAWGGLREDFYECQGWDYLGVWEDLWDDDDA